MHTHSRAPPGHLWCSRNFHENSRGGFRGSRRVDSSLTDSRPAGFWETPDHGDEGNQMDYEDWSRERAISMSATTEVRRPAKNTRAEVARRKSILAARLKP